MVFLVDSKTKIIIQTKDVEEAKSIMLHNKQRKDPIDFEVVGARDKSKFKKLYPEYKDYHFEDMNDYSIV